MSDNPETRSPLEGLSKEKFQGRTFPNEFTVTVGTSLVTILQNNPNRVHWAIINEGANDVRVSNRPDISATSGWLLGLLGGVITMDFAEDGEGCGQELFGISAVAGNIVRVREVIRS